jgi:hypothetical protein
MMPPRPSTTAADPEVVVGLLGAVAVLDDLGELIGELAADGKGPAMPATTTTTATTSSEIVDVLLGLAALAATATRRLPRATPEPVLAAPAEPVELTLRGLLR